MKKTLLFVFASACSLSQIFAQPTLSSANTSPKPGDNYITQSAKVTGAPVYGGGANQNWNYSALVDSGDAVAFQAVSPAGTPFAATFPGSNLVLKTLGDSVFSYFNSSASALITYGAGIRIDSDTSTIRYNPPRTTLPYPFTYNSSFSDSIRVQLPGFDFTFAGADSIRGDGYGSLSLPGRTFSNVLRVEYIEDLTGTGTIGGFTTTTHLRTINYLYYAPDTHAPILSYMISQSTTSIGGFPVGTASENRSIEYLKTFVLPVTFQSFTASLQNKDISLQWKTAQEINTDHFTIQRSLSGHDFQNVASVQAKGNGGSAYNYTDNSFAGSSVPPVVYYRIQSTDKDGKVLTSEIVVVRGNNVIAVSVYPNPATAYVRISSKDATVADLVAIYDAKGSLVKQWRNYSISQPINIASLAKGSYTIKIVMGGKTSSTAIIKQ